MKTIVEYAILSFLIVIALHVLDYFAAHKSIYFLTGGILFGLYSIYSMIDLKRKLIKMIEDEFPE